MNICVKFVWNKLCHFGFDSIGISTFRWWYLHSHEMCVCVFDSKGAKYRLQLRLDWGAALRYHNAAIHWVHWGVCFSLSLPLTLLFLLMSLSDVFACTVKNVSGSDVTLAAAKRKKKKKKSDDKNIAFHHFINSNDIDRHCWFKHRIVLSLAIFSLVTLFSSALYSSKLDWGLFFFSCSAPRRKTMSFTAKLKSVATRWNCMQMQPEEWQYSGNLSPYSLSSIPL